MHVIHSLPLVTVSLLGRYVLPPRSLRRPVRFHGNVYLRNERLLHFLVLESGWLDRRACVNNHLRCRWRRGMSLSLSFRGRLRHGVIFYFVWLQRRACVNNHPRSRWWRWMTAFSRGRLWFRHLAIGCTVHRVMGALGWGAVTCWPGGKGCPWLWPGPRGSRGAEITPAICIWRMSWLILGKQRWNTRNTDNCWRNVKNVLILAFITSAVNLFIAICHKLLIFIIMYWIIFLNLKLIYLLWPNKLHNVNKYYYYLFT